MYAALAKSQVSTDGSFTYMATSGRRRPQQRQDRSSNTLPSRLGVRNPGHPSIARPARGTAFAPGGAPRPVYLRISRNPGPPPSPGSDHTLHRQVPDIK